MSELGCGEVKILSLTGDFSFKAMERIEGMYLFFIWIIILLNGITIYIPLAFFRSPEMSVTLNLTVPSQGHGHEALQLHRRTHHRHPE